MKMMLCLLMVFVWTAGCETKTTSTDRCGDGFVDPGEDCDGSSLNDQTCASLGFYRTEGQLTCSPDCKFITTDCGVARCGDAVIQKEQGEQCDGTNLDGQTCRLLGHERGTLACDSFCRFDLTDCEGSGICGDGIIQAPEECDGNQLGGATCQSLGYYSGVLRCGSNCLHDTSVCTGRCGDGVIDTLYQEECDGLNLNLQTCASIGYSQGSGSLSCSEDCQFNESLCIPKSSNADLATLMVNAGTLDPAFTPGTTAYGTNVDGCVATLTVTATAADPWATVSIHPSQPMSLAMGPNTATVTVTAEDGVQKEYTVVITKTPNCESPHIGTLIYVPAGTFQRDATATNLSSVSAFRMSKYEITRAQWVAVTGWADPSHTPYSNGIDDPVQQVSWYDVIAFCNKLSLAEGLTPVYFVSGVNFTTLTYAQIPTSDNATWNAATANWAANGYRLPTEMEWMWAAMGADTANPGAVNTTGYAKAFAGSTGTNAIGDYAVFGYNTSETGRTTTERSNPVGSKVATELGFHDLSGNVWEWAWDWYATPYPTGTVTDYRGPASGSLRVFRGGDWYGSAVYCTVAYRGNYLPHRRDNSIGFRVVRP